MECTSNHELVANIKYANGAIVSHGARHVTSGGCKSDNPQRMIGCVILCSKSSSAVIVFCKISLQIMICPTIIIKKHELSDVQILKNECMHNMVLL